MLDQIPMALNRSISLIQSRQSLKTILIPIRQNWVMIRIPIAQVQVMDMMLTALVPLDKSDADNLGQDLDSDACRTGQDAIQQGRVLIDDNTRQWRSFDVMLFHYKQRARANGLRVGRDCHNFKPEQFQNQCGSESCFKTG